MSITQDITELTARFVARWNVLRSTVPVIYDNQPAVTIDPNVIHVRFTVRPGATQRQSMGISSIRHKQLGRVYIQIMTPKGKGTATSQALADDAANIFRLWRSADQMLQVFEPEITTLPASDDDYHVITVQARYEAIRIY